MSERAAQLKVGEVVAGCRVVEEITRDLRCAHYRAEGPDGSRRLLLVLSVDVDRQALSAAVDASPPSDLAAGWTSVERIAEHAGRSVLVTPWVDGAAPPTPPGPVDPAQAWEWLAPIADAVARLHASGGAHGGLSPACVVRSGGQAVVIGAHVAHLLDRPERADVFRPPEALLGARPSARASDVHALAMWFWLWVDGAPPFAAQDRRSWRGAAVGRVPWPAAGGGRLPRPLVDILNRATNPTADARPTNASVLRAALGAAVSLRDLSPETRRPLARGGAARLDGAGDGTPEVAAALLPRPPKPARGAAWRWALLAAVILLTAGTAWQLWPASPGSGDPDRCGLDSECDGGGWCSPNGCAPLGFVAVPAGTISLGAGPREPRGRDEGPMEAILTRPIVVQQTEVTQGQWRAVMGNAPSWSSECGDDCPVESVSWFDALAFANALSEEEGLPTCYELAGCTGTVGGGCGPLPPADDPEQHGCTGDFECAQATFAGIDCEGYRLPTQAEWERAARAGTRTAHYAGDMDLDPPHRDEALSTIATYAANAHVGYARAWSCRRIDPPAEGVGCGPRPARSHHPNAWLLYDMLGNVGEWTQDGWTADRTQLDRVDPLTPSGPSREVRGGSWYHHATMSRSAARHPVPANERWVDIGFRVVRTVR